MSFRSLLCLKYSFYVVVIRFMIVLLFVCFAFYFVCSVFLYCLVYCLSLCIQLFLFYLCIVYGPLPPGENPTAVNKYHIIYHIISYISYQICQTVIRLLWKHKVYYLLYKNTPLQPILCHLNRPRSTHTHTHTHTRARAHSLSPPLSHSLSLSPLSLSQNKCSKIYFYIKISSPQVS
jgi:hypothetical protein